MQVAGRGAVLIQHVSPDHGAESFNVEKRILKFERIEGPFNEADASRQRIDALLRFEQPSDSAILVRRKDTHHMTMQVGFAARFQPRDAEAKADHLTSVECAEDLASNFGGDDEEPH